MTWVGVEKKKINLLSYIKKITDINVPINLMNILYKLIILEMKREILEWVYMSPFVVGTGVIKVKTNGDYTNYRRDSVRVRGDGYDLYYGCLVFITSF